MKQLTEQEKENCIKAMLKTDKAFIKLGQVMAYSFNRIYGYSHTCIICGFNINIFNAFSPFYSKNCKIHESFDFYDLNLNKCSKNNGHVLCSNCFQNLKNKQDEIEKMSIDNLLLNIGDDNIFIRHMISRRLEK